MSGARRCGGRRSGRGATACLSGLVLLLVWGRALAAGEPTAPEGDFVDLGVRGIQLAWAVLILASPILCWRGGRAAGVGGGRLVLAVSLSVIVALCATWQRDDAPLHANGHAWREAREVLVPWGGRANGVAPFMHGRGGIALQWLLATVERTVTGAANPFRISRVASAAAAGATTFLVVVLVRSLWAGLAAGGVLALVPLAQMLAVSGSALAIPEWLLPWSLGLLIAAGLSGDRVLLAGAALATALGTLSHTAMLFWAPTLVLVWCIVARRGVRRDPFALAGLLVVAAAWTVQARDCFEMIASRNGEIGAGLLGEARMGLWQRNLFTDPHWVSPVLLPMALLWMLGALRREYRALVAATVLALGGVAIPFFAVMACSSDAVRYQGALLGLVTSLAVAGLWIIPASAWIGHAGATIVRLPLLAMMVLLPPGSLRSIGDPVAIEHGLVADAVRRMQPGTLVVLPRNRFEQGRVIPDFPDFLLPKDSQVRFQGDPTIAFHEGPVLVYLGIACISWSDPEGFDGSDVRPECRYLREHVHPWFVRSLRVEDLPRGRSGDIWTFHQLATGVPFGFFEPN